MAQEELNYKLESTGDIYQFSVEEPNGLGGYIEKKHRRRNNMMKFKADRELFPTKNY